MKVRFVGGPLDRQTLECPDRLDTFTLLTLSTKSGVRDFVSVPFIRAGIGRGDVPRLAAEGELDWHEVYERIRLDEDLIELRYVGWEAYEEARRETERPWRPVLWGVLIILAFPVSLSVILSLFLAAPVVWYLIGVPVIAWLHWLVWFLLWVGVRAGSETGAPVRAWTVVFHWVFSFPLVFPGGILLFWPLGWLLRNDIWAAIALGLLNSVCWAFALVALVRWAVGV